MPNKVATAGRTKADNGKFAWEDGVEEEAESGTGLGPNRVSSADFLMVTVTLSLSSEALAPSTM